ncbi:hypothetical protein GGR57DRAFT_476434 [Xylariaceae sp. FL1272]|nr:hypothetical protein GGR57DRAFT_476434 [Xylariaceae sp. FL1272]
MSETYNITAGTINLSSPRNGDNVWEVEQTDARGDEVESSGSMLDFTWSYGPNHIIGSVDRDTLDITIKPLVAGLYLGVITGSLKDGVQIHLNLQILKGIMNFYLKNGNEVWIHLDEKVVFNGSYSNDYKILVL